MIDYHTHSHVSHDGIGRILEHARRAEEIGLTEICLTEHLDFYISEDGFPCCTIPTETQLRSYLEEIREVQGMCRIPVRAGVELDYKPEADYWIRDMLQRFSFDFVLGSVHNVGDWPVSGPKELAIDYFQERGVLQGCLDYFDIVEQAVATGLFDSFAHLDLMKRFKPENGKLMRQGVLRDRIAAVLDRMVATGTGMEVNASGIFHPAGEPYPGLQILKLARDRGVGMLTIGSDSHRPETVGRGLEAALSLARAAGYRSLCTFERRQARVVAL